MFDITWPANWRAGGVNCKHYKVPLVSIGHNQTIGNKLTDLPSCVINIEQEAYGETPVNKDECTLYVSYYTEKKTAKHRARDIKWKNLEQVRGYVGIYLCHILRMKFNGCK